MFPINVATYDLSREVIFFIYITQHITIFTLKWRWVIDYISVSVDFLRICLMVVVINKTKKFPFCNCLVEHEAC